MEVTVKLRRRSAAAIYFRRMLQIMPAFVLFYEGCHWNAELPNCSNPSPTYHEDILPIVKGYCSSTGCHEPGALIGNFENYDTLFLQVENGNLNLMVYELAIMPPGAELPEDEKQILECWMNGGAPE